MSSERTKVLIVDDRRENLVALQALLEDMDFEIHTATSGNDALGALLEHEFAVVLMDVQMPEMDGFETVELMKQSRRTRDVPVLYLTAISKDMKHVFRGYEVGAVDYIFKPVEPLILRGKIKVLVALYEANKKLAERNQQLEEATRKLHEAAMTDPLTGLHNRRFLKERIQDDTALARRAAWGQKKGRDLNPDNRFLGFLIVDVDHFKRVNDEHGHDAGDAVLTQFSTRLRDAVRESDDVVRWGGEEFLVLLRQTDAGFLAHVANRLCRTVEGEPFVLPSGLALDLTCSVGFGGYPFGPLDQFDWEDVVTIADSALGHAKQTGRNKALGLGLARDGVDPQERKIVLHEPLKALELGLLTLIEHE